MIVTTERVVTIRAPKSDWRTLMGNLEHGLEIHGEGTFVWEGHYPGKTTIIFEMVPEAELDPWCEERVKDET